MANEFEAERQNRQQQEMKVDDILRRVDSLPVLDSRPADEILGYDRNGLLAQDESCTAFVPSVSDDVLPQNTIDFEAYREEVLSDPGAREAIEVFLKHRHRERES